MSKTIMITGSTDGIGMETAMILVSRGHRVILHGRNPQKVEQVKESLSTVQGSGHVESYVADLSLMKNVADLADEIKTKHDRLDVLINNAGVFNTSRSTTSDGLDVRFAVNTMAPYLLTYKLLPLLGGSGRVINLSSAAQASVNLDALTGERPIADDGAAYAQSKLAITMWTRMTALALDGNGPMMVAVNPGSLLGTKMVRDAYGMDGKDVRIGADILVRASLSDEFADANGRYFDNDRGIFASPHPDALNNEIAGAVTSQIRVIIETLIKEEL